MIVKSRRVAVASSETLRNTIHFPVSAAEVDDQDSRNSAVLGFVMISSSEKVIAPVLERIERHVETLGLAEIVSVDVEFIHCQGG